MLCHHTKEFCHYTHKKETHKPIVVTVTMGSSRVNNGTSKTVFVCVPILSHTQLGRYSLKSYSLNLQKVAYEKYISARFVIIKVV